MNPASRLSVGLCSVTFRGLAPSDVIGLAAESGVAGIEWGSDKHVPPGDFDNARGVAAACRARGVAVASIGSYVEAGADQGQAFAEILEIASAMQAPNIRLWAGRRGIGSAEASETDRRRAADAMRRMGAEAAARDIALGLEYHPDTLTDDLGSTLALIAAVDRPNLWSYWQPRPGIALAEALDEIEALDGRISHVHVFAWTAAKERLALAEHEEFWLPALARIVRTRYRGPRPRYAMLEFVAGDDPDAFRADAGTLSGWLDRLGGSDS
jgi:sugar phosphate isomerase/epimerase